MYNIINIYLIIFLYINYYEYINIIININGLDELVSNYQKIKGLVDT